MIVEVYRCRCCVCGATWEAFVVGMRGCERCWPVADFEIVAVVPEEAERL